MNPKDQEWALFWCSLLHGLIFEEIAPEDQARHLRELSQQKRRFPNGAFKQASLSTLKRKWRCYQDGGFEALARKNRSDRGQPRKVSAEIIAHAVEYKKDLPTRSVCTINQFLENHHQLTIPRSTLYR